MLENFIYAKEKSLFEEALNNGEVLDEAIVFIEDTKLIWNHGTYFDCLSLDDVYNKFNNYYTKDESDTKFIIGDIKEIRKVSVMPEIPDADVLYLVV